MVTEPESHAGRAKVVPRDPPAIDVQSILQGLPEVRLVHRGESYRLRVTKQGKLILTK